MRRTTVALLVATLLAVPIAVVSPAPLPAPPPAQAEALPPGARAVVGIVRLFAARNARSHVYREARTTQADIDAYYDGLRETARTQLHSSQQVSVGQTRARTYLSLVANIEGEREMATTLIEAEKDQARRQFNRTLGREVLGVLVRSPAAGKIIGQLRDNVEELRQSIRELKASIESGSTVAGAIERFVAKVPPIPELQALALEVSGRLYDELDTATRGALSIHGLLEEGAVEATDGMLNALDSADRRLASLEQSRAPMSSADLDAELGRLLAPEPGGDDGPVVIAADTIGKNVARKLVDQIDEAQYRRMIDRVKAELLTQRLEALDKPAVELDDETVCRRVSSGEYQAALGALGRAGEFRAPASEAEEPFYFVCYQGETPIAAWIIGDEDEDEDDEDEVTPATDIVQVVNPGTYVGTFEEAPILDYGAIETGAVLTNSVEIDVRADATFAAEIEFSYRGDFGLGCLWDGDDSGSVKAGTGLGAVEPVVAAMQYHYHAIYRGEVITGGGGDIDCSVVEHDEGDEVLEFVFSEEGGAITGHIGLDGEPVFPFTAFLQG